MIKSTVQGQGHTQGHTHIISSSDNNLSIVYAGNSSGAVPSCEESRQIGRVTAVEEDRRPGPEVLKPFTGPRLRRLSLSGVLKQYGVHHVQTRTERIVRLPLTTPRVQPERGVPLEYRYGNGYNSGRHHDGDPHPSVERL